MANKADIKKVTAAAALAVALLCGAALAQTAVTPVAKHGQLSVKDGKVVNKDGVPVALRGMSFFWDQWNEGSEYYTAAVVNELAENWKVDVVRVAFSGPNGNASRCKTVVDAAVARGIYVVLDYHSHSAHSEVQNAWAFLKPYAESPKVNYLYEIYNEPIGASGTNTQWNADHQAYWNNTIKPYAVTMVDSIRAKDKNNLILIGTPYYSLQLETAVANPLTGANATNLAYVLHFYSGANDDGIGHKTDKAAPIISAVAKGLAVFVSEFGTCGPSGNGTYDFVEANKWFEILDRYSVGWCNWSICNKAEKASAVTNGAKGDGTGWTDNNITEGGRFIKAKLLDYRNKTQTITVNAGAGGKVTRNVGDGPYQYGTVVTLTAVPDNGYEFSGWSGGASGRAASVGIGPLYENKTVSAAFVKAGNMIANGTFTGSVSGWSGSGSTRALDNNELKITVTAGGSSSSDAALRTTGLPLDGGYEYELVFRARSAVAGKALKVKFSNSNRDVDYLTPLWDVPLSTTMETYTKTFSMCKKNSNNEVISDASAVLHFECGGSGEWAWYIDDVELRKVGQSKECTPSPVATPSRAQPIRSVWSVAKVGSGWQLRGPAEQGSVVSIYTTGGKVVRSMEARDGLTLNMAGVAAGNYFVVVKNRRGGEVYRNRVSMVR